MIRSTDCTNDGIRAYWSPKRRMCYTKMTLMNAHWTTFFNTVEEYYRWHSQKFAEFLATI